MNHAGKGKKHILSNASTTRPVRTVTTHGSIAKHMLLFFPHEM